ncbi:MAG: hypothetical protein ACOCQE_00955 [Halanaerobium sp.]
MEKYLLVLFSYAGLENLNNFLLNKLNSGDQLFVRAVMLKGVPRLYSHLTSDVGFLGDKVASDVEESVVDIYYENARDYLKEIEEKAAADGIEIDKDLIENRQIDKLKSVIRKSDFDSVIVNFSNNEFVSDQLKEKQIKKWLNTIERNKYIFHDGKRG